MRFIYTTAKRSKEICFCLRQIQTKYHDIMTSWHGNGFHVASLCHYNGVILGVITSQISSLTIVYSAVYSDADQRKHQRSASLAFVWGIHRWPVNSPHKGPVTRKMFPFHDVIMWRESTSRPTMGQKRETLMFIFILAQIYCLANSQSVLNLRERDTLVTAP